MKKSTEGPLQAKRFRLSAALKGPTSDISSVLAISAFELGVKLKSSGIRSISSNAGHLARARVFTQIVRGIYVLVLARRLGPEAYGLFAYGQSWYLAFLPLAILGLGAILSREVGRKREKGAEVVGQTLALQLFLALAGALICGLAGWFAETAIATRLLLVVFSLALAGRSFAVWAEQVFVAFEESRYAFRQEALFRPLEAVVGLSVLAAGGGVIAVTAVHALVWWLQAARGLLIVHHRLVPVKAKWEWRNLLRIGCQGSLVCLSALFSSWLLQGPLILYRHVAGTENSLGQVALAIQVLVLTCTIPLSISNVSLPVLSRAVARQDGKDVQFMEGMLRISIFLGAAAGLLGMGIGPFLTRTLLGGSYGGTGQLLGPALWLLAPLTAGAAAGQVLIARGRLVPLSLSALTGALVLTLSLPPLAAATGPLGAVLAAGAGMSVRALSLVLLLNRARMLDLGLAVLRPGLAALLALGTYLGLGTLNSGMSTPVSLVVLVSAGLLLGALRQDEREAIRTFLPKGKKEQRK